MIKATKPTGTPKQQASGSQRDRLVYIGNVRGDTRSWPWAGSGFKRHELFRRIIDSGTYGKSRSRSGATHLRDGAGATTELRPKHVQSNDKLRVKGLGYKIVMRVGIAIGDAFLVYGTGAALVIRKRRDGGGYWLSPLKRAERLTVTQGERTARRNLRWEAGSFCYHEASRERG